MDVIDAIMTRRSIRRYRPLPIPECDIERILKAAMAAPSSKNEQPWVFTVIDDRELLNKIPKFHPHAEMIKSSPVAILVCADRKRFLSENIWIQDCAAATLNILLAAHGLRLGAVWLGIYPRVERVRGMSKLVNLPKHIVPFSLVALGYPAEKRSPADRFDPDRIHRNRWEH